MMTKESATALAAWMLKEHPGAFAVILKRVSKGMSGLGDDVTAVDPSTLTAPGIDLSVSSTPIDTTGANLDTSSLLSSIGSGVSDAVSNVANFLLKGASIAAPVAVAAINAQTAASNQAKNAQLATLNAQYARASAGLPPANITYTASGQPVYVPSAPSPGSMATMPYGLGAPVTLPSGQVGYTLTPQALSNLQPTFLQKYGLLLAAGAGVLVLVMMLSRGN